MNDVLSTLVVVLAITTITAILAQGFERSLRSWVWIALAEYLVCAAAQLVWSTLILNGGGDGFAYTRRGLELAKFLDSNFSWASREMVAMLLQQPSGLDPLIETPQSNTGSMFAVATWLSFLLRSSVAVHVFAAGLSLFASLSIFKAFQAGFPEARPVRLFVATVLFPSVAFWTSALHKESICLIGMGLLFAAWRAAYRRQLRAIIYLPLGVGMILLFRAPALPPIALGLVVYFVVDRFQKTRGADAVVVGPLYLAVGLGVLALAMLAVAQVTPGLGLGQLSETMSQRQRGWARSQGGSAVDVDDGDIEVEAPQGLGGQLIRVPRGLLNALFRPQLFDVHNIGTLIGAIEMTALTLLVIGAIRHYGLKGIVGKMERSPFLLMCAVVTLVGCTFVGLVTLNLGSLARYRVPFLPFYGALVLSLSPERARNKERVAPAANVQKRAMRPLRGAARLSPAPRRSRSA